MISKTQQTLSARLAKAVLILVFIVASVPAIAQFKAVGPAPYSATVARQKIKTLLAAITPANQQQTITTISGLLVWFRDIADDELIAAWKKDAGRENLIEAVTALADARVASTVVEFSWRERREATFQLAYAPMFGNLMLRFPDSPKLFVDDLVGSGDGSGPALNLTEAEQYTVCRILLDMPDIGQWNKTALRILPHYREAAVALLTADLNQGNADKRYRAQNWMAVLRPAPVEFADQRNQRTNSRPSLSVRGQSAAEGSLECKGDPIPKDGEYVFHNVPVANRRFEFDRKIWDVRLEPGQADTKNFILKNISSKSQRGCSVHWTVVP